MAGADVKPGSTSKRMQARTNVIPTKKAPTIEELSIYLIK